jgi:hypothetical protein
LTTNRPSTHIICKSTTIHQQAQINKHLLDDMEPSSGGRATEGIGTNSGHSSGGCATDGIGTNSGTGSDKAMATAATSTKAAPQMASELRSRSPWFMLLILQLQNTQQQNHLRRQIGGRSSRTQTINRICRPIHLTINQHDSGESGNYYYIYALDNSTLLQVYKYI